MGDGCWSELPHLYARYGTTATGALIGRLKQLEQASAVLVCSATPECRRPRWSSTR
jgi:hypothetical protein